VWADEQHGLEAWNNTAACVGDGGKLTGMRYICNSMLAKYLLPSVIKAGEKY
jgi:hypothetical protein